MGSGVGVNPKLSLCIATYNRANYISETLDGIVKQLTDEVEVVVVDGASPDHTSEVMKKYVSNSKIRYYKEIQNSGIDGDYDKAVEYSTGEYCWLMTDDDCLQLGAISRVLSELRSGKDLLLVNAEVMNADMSISLRQRMVPIAANMEYSESDKENFFSDNADLLSFIGCVVIKRSVWLERERECYYGSLFIHVGVIFQHEPITNAMVVADPLIQVRYGNAMWTARGFEVWVFLWPSLIWSFKDFSDDTKHKVCAREPWRQFKVLFKYRALGVYSLKEFSRLIGRKELGLSKIKAYLVAVIPAKLANVIGVLYTGLFNRSSKMGMYDLLNSKNNNIFSQFMSKLFSSQQRL